MSEPQVTIRAAHDSGTPNLPPTRYVVHCTAGGLGYPRESASGRAAATARYFQTQGSGGSAHYIHDAGGHEEHPVPEDVIAWHAPPNPHSIGDEICGEPSYTREQWLSDEVWPAVHASALRCREVCDRRGIPKVKLSPADLLAGKHGICGHVDVSGAWHQSTHWDPGPNFPWDRYMAVVTGQDQEGFLMALTDAQQEEMYRWMRDLSTIKPPYTGAPTPTQLVLGDIFVNARRAAAAIDTKAVAAELAKDLPKDGTPVSDAQLDASLKRVLGSLDDPA